jgi:hypothetical protein
MRIQRLDKETEDEYEDFILRNENSLIYYSVKYKNFLEELLDGSSEYLIARDSGIVKGVLPLFYNDGRFGRVYNSLPFFGSNGGIIAESQEAFEILLNEYNNIAEDEKTCSSTIVTNPLIENNYSHLKCDLTDERIGQFTVLPPSSDGKDNLMSKIDSTARRNIRKAAKSGITVRIDNSQVKFLKQIHKDNMNAIGGKSKSEMFFVLVEKYFRKGGDYNIYVAEKGGRLIAALMIFYFNRTVEYFVPAIVEEFRTYQPLALIVYNAMVDASKMGYTLWNWGGTWPTQEGVYRFKKKWDSFDRRYNYFVKINNTEIYESSKEELSEEYMNFYVIPFDKLRG